MKKEVLVPPEGGYGWVIVCASALNAFICIPIMQNFGLIFKDTFTEKNFTMAQGSFIINVNAAFGMLTAFLSSALLKYFGYRKMAMFGAFLLVTGIIMTSISVTFVHFVIAYGIITSYGVMSSMSAFNLAVNTYFKKRKARAVAIATTLSGLGPILMPQLITGLMRFHTVQGVTLLLAGVSTHCILAAQLLHPVRWYMRREVVEVDDAETTVNTKLQRLEEEEEDDERTPMTDKKTPQLRFSRSLSFDDNVELRRKHLVDVSEALDEYDVESPAIFGIDSTLGGSMLSLDNFEIGNRVSSLRISQLPTRLGTPFKTKWWSSSTISLGSNNDEKRRTVSEGVERYRRISTRNTIPEMAGAEHEEDPQDVAKKPRSHSKLKRALSWFAQLYDLDLLRDPVYVNIILGLSLAIFAEFNFSVLTAFILDSFGLETYQIGVFASVIGFTDLIFRFLTPYIGELLNLGPRPMFMMSIAALVCARFTMIYLNDFTVLLCLATFQGMAKGIRTVNMSLIIPTYVPLEKLASASGIQSTMNGLCVIIGGPLLGVVRDLTGSYTWCIVIMNIISLLTIGMWSVELVITSRRNKSEES